VRDHGCILKYNFTEDSAPNEAVLAHLRKIVQTQAAQSGYVTIGMGILFFFMLF
jgi:hypothetical protein